MSSQEASAAERGANGVSRVREAGAAPVLGLIFPPEGRGVPEEGVAMYGEQLRFVVTGLGVERMTPAGFDAVMARIPAAARQLAEAGANAIELTGTSLTFYKGEAFNRQLCELVSRTSGLPATTMSNGVMGDAQPGLETSPPLGREAGSL